MNRACLMKMEQARHATPTAAEAVNAWMEHMRAGRFTEAWSLNDALRGAAAIPSPVDIPRHLQSIWTGASVDGRRVLVRCYHGLGDTIQFIRYAPLLRERVARLFVWVQPALIPVLSSVEGVDALVPLHDGEPGVLHDVDIEIMELPYLFRTTVTSIPAAVPYLHVPPLPIHRNEALTVGLVWRAGGWAAHRSIPFAALEPITSLPAACYVLQGLPGLDERPPGFGTVAGTHDLLELARVVRSVDLLITVDSMPAHLAGALGTPVWTMLAADADWRWMTGRENTPWYPTMRLFRQERAGDWGPVVERVASELRRVIAARSRS